MSTAAARATRGRQARRTPAAARTTPRRAPAGGLVRTVRRLQLRRAALVLATLVCLALLKVWVGNQVVATGYDLEALRREQLRLEEYRQQLEVELATQQGRASLEERARRTLGLGAPRRGQVVDVR